MKKDYIPLAVEQTDLSEIDLVEEQWTAIWGGARLASRADPGIARREEYRLMAPYLAQMRAAGGNRLLDAGCGLGEWTVFLSSQGYDVYGVDISRQTIDRLCARFAQCHFTCADVRRLDSADGFFDACFSWGVFEHFEEGLGPCIEEAWRALRPGGYLFVSVPFHNWRHILRDARPLRRWDEAYDPERGFGAPRRFYQWRLTIPELERELAMRRFRVLQIQPIHVIEGLRRAVSLDLHIDPSGRAYAMAERLLRRVAPRRVFCHMLVAAAQKVQPW